MTEEEKLELLCRLQEKYGKIEVNQEPISREDISREEILTTAVEVEEKYGTDQDGLALLSPEEFLELYPDADINDENAILLGKMLAYKCAIEKKIAECQSSIANINGSLSQAQDYWQKFELKDDSLYESKLLYGYMEDLKLVIIDINLFRLHIIGSSRGI